MKKFSVKVFYVISICVLSSCSGAQKGKIIDSDSTEVIVSSESENTVAQDNSRMVDEVLEDRIKTIWFSLPPALEGHGSTEFKNRVTSIMTDSFKNIFSKGYQLYQGMDINTDPGTQVDIAEALFNFWGGQDPDINGHFSSIKVINATEDKITLEVEYLNYSNPEQHTMVLKQENGEWLIDNFDNVREIINQTCAVYQVGV